MSPVLNYHRNHHANLFTKGNLPMHSKIATNCCQPTCCRQHFVFSQPLTSESLVVRADVMRSIHSGCRYLPTLVHLHLSHASYSERLIIISKLREAEDLHSVTLASKPQCTRADIKIQRPLGISLLTLISTARRSGYRCLHSALRGCHRLLRPRARQQFHSDLERGENGSTSCSLAPTRSLPLKNDATETLSPR